MARESKGKETGHLLAAVEETSLIPLYARALAPRLFPEMGFSDDAAEDIVSLLGHDPWRFIRTDRATARGIVMREQWFDRECLDFFNRHPHAQVLNLGAGLNTNFQRLSDRYNGVMPDWVNVDLPPVIALRDKLLPARDDVTNMSLDLSRHGSLRQLPLHRSSPVLILLEGVIMYLQPSKGAALIRDIADTFSTHPQNVEILLDYASPYLAMMSRWHPSISETGARFRWGVNGAHEIMRIAPQLSCRKDDDLMQQCGLAGWGVSSMYQMMTLGSKVYGCSAFRVVRD